MAYKERVQILSDAEQSDFYNPPILASNDQRFFFALNDQELTVANKLRSRGLRYMFVMLLGYLSGHKIAILAYSTLQKIISHVINEQQTRLIAHIKHELSRDLTQALTDLAADDGALTLRQLRQSARNFRGTELEKELAIDRYIQHWMPEVNTLFGSQWVQIFLAID